MYNSGSWGAAGGSGVPYEYDPSSAYGPSLPGASMGPMGYGMAAGGYGVGSPAQYGAMGSEVPRYAQMPPEMHRAPIQPQAGMGDGGGQKMVQMRPAPCSAGDSWALEGAGMGVAGMGWMGNMGMGAQGGWAQQAAAAGGGHTGSMGSMGSLMHPGMGGGGMGGASMGAAPMHGHAPLPRSPHLTPQMARLPQWPVPQGKIPQGKEPSSAAG